MTITEHDAEKQQAELRKIMAEQRVPFQDAVNVYIERRRGNHHNGSAPTIVLARD